MPSYPPIRVEYRVALSDVERSVEATGQLIIGQSPEELNEHLTLRVLAWCLAYEPRLEFGPGVDDPDGADLWAHDLTGRVSTWIDCGPTAADKIRRVVRHRRGAVVHVMLDSAEERARLDDELKRGPRVEATRLWLVDAQLVAALAAQDARRHRWAVTIVGGRIYVDSDGLPLEGAVESFQHAA